MGDGILAEFGTAVEVVECATEIQREVALATKGTVELGREFLSRPG
jgi:hypothetical protein